MTITGAQIKAVRQLLGWSRMKLAVQAEINFRRLLQFEQLGKSVSPEAYEKLIGVLEAAGVEFAKGRGAAKLRNSK
jgi:transcriptional regulator with XRE-family HTH domain